MTKNGVRYPEVVDLVSVKDGTYELLLIETNPLTSEDAFALQEKLKNYLAFGLDGQLFKLYPDSRGRPLTIRVMLEALPEPFILEFLRNFETYIGEEGVSLVVDLVGKRIAL
jgi:hypothetical protein